MDASINRDALSRRDVLKAAAAAVSLSALSAGLGGCETRPALPKVTTGQVNVGPAANYPAGTVSTAYVEQYGIALANDSGTVLAIDVRCTHKACPTKWMAEQNLFVCGCHGSLFNILGQVQKGPATKPLRGVAASRNADGTLTVDLDKLYHG